MEPLCVLEQGNRAVERTALAGHAHRPSTVSILFGMPATIHARHRIRERVALAWFLHVIAVGPGR